MKTIDFNFTPEIVKQHTQLISKIFANGGTQMFKVETRLAWPCATKEEFEAERRKYDTGEKKGFILNQSPVRICLKNLLIVNVALVQDLDGEICIAINPHNDDDNADMILPINNSTLDIMGKTTRDAISEAITGQKDHFFLDGKELAAIVNAYMQKQITQLEDLKESINKMVVKLKGDIDANTKKAKDAADSWANSALPVQVDMPSGVNGANVHLTVNKTQD
jgi:hypothetical protein